MRFIPLLLLASSYIGATQQHLTSSTPQKKDRTCSQPNPPSRIYDTPITNSFHTTESDTLIRSQLDIINLENDIPTPPSQAETHFRSVMEQYGQDPYVIAHYLQTNEELPMESVERISTILHTLKNEGLHTILLPDELLVITGVKDIALIKKVSTDDTLNNSKLNKINKILNSDYINLNAEIEIDGLSNMLIFASRSNLAKQLNVPQSDVIKELQRLRKENPAELYDRLGYLSARITPENRRLYNLVVHKITNKEVFFDIIETKPTPQTKDSLTRIAKVTQNTFIDENLCLHPKLIDYYQSLDPEARNKMFDSFSKVPPAILTKKDKKLLGKLHKNLEKMIPLKKGQGVNGKIGGPMSSIEFKPDPQIPHYAAIFKWIQLIVES